MKKPDGEMKFNIFYSLADNRAIDLLSILIDWESDAVSSQVQMTVTKTQLDA